MRRRLESASEGPFANGAYVPPKARGPAPPSDGVLALQAQVKDLGNDERARIRRWVSRCVTPDGQLDEPEYDRRPLDLVMTGRERTIMVGVQALEERHRLYFRKWILAWFAPNGFHAEPQFITKRRGKKE